MKTLFILSLLVYIWSPVAESTNFEATVLETIDNLHKASTVEDIQACVSKLERITISEPKRWEAHYYLAYSRIKLSFSEENGEKIDAILDLAESDIKKSLDLGGDKSELNALHAYLYQGRIKVNAMRGMKYSRLAAETLEEAIQQNPSNARAHFLMGMNVYHTPTMFGGGASKAKPHFSEAMECFDKASAEKSIFPHWGMEITQNMLESCEKEK